MKIRVSQVVSGAHVSPVCQNEAINLIMQSKDIYIAPCVASESNPSEAAYHYARLDTR